MNLEGELVSSEIWFKMALDYDTIPGKTVNVSVFYTVFTHNGSPYTQIMAISTQQIVVLKGLSSYQEV